MTTLNLWRATLAAAALAIVGGSLALAQPAGSGKTAVPGAPAGKAGNGDTGDLRTFQLTYADPEEVRGIVTQMGASLTARPGSKPTPGAVTTLRLAVDPRTKTLFVRGTEKELDAVADLVAILDADPSKPAAEGKSTRVIRLRHVQVGEVMQVLTGLNLQNQVIPLTRTKALLLTGTDTEKEIRAVVEKLDVEPRTSVKPPTGGKKPTPPVGD
jgi:hypothetical protein